MADEQHEMKKLTTKAGKFELSALWLACPTGMALYQPLRLVKIAGPVAIGIYLEPTRGGDAFTPIAHLHSFCVEFPTIALTPAIRGDLMTLAGTTPESVRRAFSALVVRASVIADAPTIRYMDLLALYETHVSDGRFPVVTAYLPVYSDMVGLTTYAGRTDDARRIVERVEAASESLSDKQRARVQEWKDGLGPLLDRGLLEERVRSEKKKHNVESVPEVELSS